jgi:hypothetical protein
MLRWRMEIGNLGFVSELSQSRKSSCGSSLMSFYSISFSRSGIHDIERWQLARNTQYPFSVASLNALIALLACPLPSGMVSSSLPFSFARKAS